MDDEQKWGVGTALRIVNTAPEVERIALLHWMVQLLQIRDSNVSSLQKARLALAMTKNQHIVWPLLKAIAQELKRVGWDDRSKKGRAAIGVGGVVIAAVGGKGAGIAAFGTAIGVPLWVVLGGGAYFAVGIIEGLMNSVPVKSRPTKRGDGYIVDVEEVKPEVPAKRLPE